VDIPATSDNIPGTLVLRGADSTFSVGGILVGYTENIGFQTVQIHSTSPADVVGVYRWVDDNAGPRITLHKSRSTSPGSYTLVQNGDVLGTISFRGDDGINASSSGASIQGIINGTPGASDMPGALRFNTAPSGSATPIARMHIGSAGDIGVGTTSPSSRLHVAGDLTVSSATTATTATAGTSGDVPAQVVGYLVVSINGTSRKIPYYAT
jgi:hypothetical protein